MSHLFALHFWI